MWSRRCEVERLRGKASAKLYLIPLPASGLLILLYVLHKLRHRIPPLLLRRPSIIMMHPLDHHPSRSRSFASRFAPQSSCIPLISVVP
jgi:hypothetical protein